MTKTKNILAAIAAVIICGFAAAVSESANAQEARVYKSPPDMAYFGNVNFTDPLTVIVTAYGDNTQVDIWGLLEGGTAGGQTLSFVTTSLSADGLPLYMVGGSGTGRPLEHIVVAAGDYILFAHPAGLELPVSLLLYDNGADGLHLAEGNEAVTLKAAADLAADEFFLDADFASTRIAAEGVQGFVPAPLTETDCAEMPTSQVLDSDANMCRLPETDAECAGLYDGARPEFVNDASAGNCQAETQTPGNGGGGGDNGDNTSGGSGDETVVRSNDKRDFPVVGAIVMGLLIFGLSNGGEEGEFSTSPAFGYSVNESGYSANVGGRMDFRKDEWTLFYTGGQTNANGKFGDFRYSSGGEYKADFWKAAFSESVSGETADYDLSLSADLQGGIWQFSPVYRMNARLEEGESATRNSLNLEGILRYDDWRITPSAGFGWRRADEFGDSAKFRLEAVREF